MEARSEILRGTLDLMVLKTLDVLGPLHGYGIPRRIRTEWSSLLAARVEIAKFAKKGDRRSTSILQDVASILLSIIRIAIRSNIELRSP